MFWIFYPRVIYLSPIYMHGPHIHNWTRYKLYKILTLVSPGSSIGSAPFLPCHRKSTFWSFSFFLLRLIFWLVHLNIYEIKNDEQGIYKEMNSFFTLFWKENIYKTPWFHCENLHIFTTVFIFEILRISMLSKLKKINRKYSWNF